MNASGYRVRRMACSNFVSVCLIALAIAGTNGTAGRAQTAPQSPAAPTKPRARYSLEMLIQQANWDVSQRGPLLALDPLLTYRSSVDLPVPGPAGYDLRLAAPGFDRILVSVGTIAVLAPTTMTLIEDKPRERPNLYDGLPRDIKVKYLMSTLTPQQWKTLSEKGLSASDLTGEQQPVYLSLLPNPFIVKRWPRDANGVVSGNNSLVTLTPDERAQVRLRVHRSAQVMAPLQNKPNTYMLASIPDEQPGQPNGVKWERDGRADTQKTDLFGINLSSVVPNKSKPSQLDYMAARLNASVSLEGAATLGDMIARISAVTHLEVYADGRVARLPLMVRGGKARAGDVLKTLALAVTGTFRRIDTAFVLTSDLIGIGTRQMRLAEWQRQIQAQTEQLEKELTRQIVQHSGKNGGVLALGYAATDPYALTPAIEQEAQKNRDIPGTSLTPALQQLLHEVATHQEKQSPNDDRIRDDAARIDIYWRFAFQLPNGAMLAPEGYAGSASEYYPSLEDGHGKVGVASDLKPFARHPLPAWATPRTLFLTPRSPQDAILMTQTAQRLGFTELVLHTENKTALKAAIAEAGKAQAGTQDALRPLQICAAIAPFAAAITSNGAISREGPDDVNLMSETAAQIVAARSAQPRWNTYSRRKMEGSFPHFVPERIAGVPSAFAPIGAHMEARFHAIADLARTEGLAGLFLYDTQPGGYAGKRSAFISTNDQVLFERENLGYVPAMRLAFLRQSGVDPLDLTPPHINVDVDLRLPYFPDKVAASSEEHMPDFTPLKGEAWDKFRAETNRKAMADLFALLRAANPNLPLMVEARSALINVAEAAWLWPAWASWTQPDNLFVGASALHDDKKRPLLAKGERYLFPVQFSASDLLPAQTVLREEMDLLQNIRRTTGEHYPLALDFRYLPAPRALALLNEYVSPTPQTQPSPDTKN